MNENQSVPFITRSQFDFGEGATIGLRLTLVATSSAPIDVRGYTKAGNFNYTIVPVGNSSLEVFDLAIPDVPIAVSVMADINEAERAYHYCILNLMINGNKSVLLAQGSINPLFGVTWPHQIQPTQLQLDGFPEIVSNDEIAAGNELEIVVPDNQVWEILGVQLNLDTDATAANRTVQLQLGITSDEVILRSNGTAVTANQVIALMYIPGGTTGVTIANQAQEIALPQRIFIAAGGAIKTSTTNLQAGDQFILGDIYIRRHFAVAQ